LIAGTMKNIEEKFGWNMNTLSHHSGNTIHVEIRIHALMPASGGTGA